MRLSSFVALVVATASLALGGCAADAEPAEASSPDVVEHGGAAAGEDRSGDVRLIPKHSDEGSSLAIPDSARARLIETYEGDNVDPRLEVQPPSFNHRRTRAAGIVSPEQMEAAAEAHNTGSPKP